MYLPHWLQEKLCSYLNRSNETNVHPSHITTGLMPELLDVFPVKLNFCFGLSEFPRLGNIWKNIRISFSILKSVPAPPPQPLKGPVCPAWQSTSRRIRWLQGVNSWNDLSPQGPPKKKTNHLQAPTSWHSDPLCFIPNMSTQINTCPDRRQQQSHHRIEINFHYRWVTAIWSTNWPTLHHLGAFLQGYWAD